MKLIPIFIAFILFSCKKDVVSTPTIHTVQGLWIGTYTMTQSPTQGALFYSLSIYPDGTLLVKTRGNDAKSYYATGSWSLNSSNEFSANVVTMAASAQNEITQEVKGTYSKSTGTLTNCTWRDTNNPLGSVKDGKITVEEVR